MILPLDRLLLALAVLALAACSSSSAPVHYHTLLPARVASSRQAPLTAQLLVQSLRMPVQVDQPLLVLRRSDGTLAILEQEQWGAPLADEFHSALSRHLEGLLGVRELSGLPRDPARDLLTLRIDVRRFESLPGQYTLLDAAWNLNLSREGRTRRSLTCSSLIKRPATDTPAATGIDALVLAHQGALAELAKEIAATARDWIAQPSAGCR